MYFYVTVHGVNNNPFMPFIQITINFFSISPSFLTDRYIIHSFTGKVNGFA